ncbi:MAG: 4Fe-4S dicluster domain-containing protein [bacterium]
MKCLVDIDVLRSDFIREIEKESGQKVSSCYQCGKCSSGCPIVFEMDYLPNQIIRMVQLSMEERVLSSRTIWLCAGCETCTTRCPREVDLAKVMDALRIIALRKKVKPSEKDVNLFNRLFLSTVRKYGRVFEVEMIGRFNLGSGHFFKDIFKGPKLFKRGKLKIFPTLADGKKMKEIFKGTEK